MMRGAGNSEKKLIQGLVNQTNQNNFFSKDEAKKTQRQPTIVRKKEFKTWVLYPHMKWVGYWSLLVELAILITLVVAPYVIAFVDRHKGETSPLGAILFLAFAEIIFLLDLFISFFMAYEHVVGEEKFLIDNHKAMAIRYLSTYFVIDLLSLGVPFNFAYELDLSDTALTVLNLCSLLKVFRITKLKGIFSGAFTFGNVMYARMIKMAVFFLLATHIFGCMFYGISEWEVDSRKSNSTWITEETFNNVPIRDCDRDTKLVVSLYWSMVTILTTGYGDITPYTSSEMLLTMLYMVVGAILYAWILAHITDFVFYSGASSSLYTKKKTLLEKFINAYEIPADLAQRLHDSVDFTWEMTQGLDMDGAMEGLPRVLQTDIKCFIHAEILLGNPLFMNSEEGLIRAVVEKLVGQHFKEGEWVFRQDDACQEMFILRRGEISIVREGRLLATMKPGNIFGEIGLFKSIPRTASARAKRDSHLYMLFRDDFDAVVELFPSFKRNMGNKANQRLNQPQKDKNRKKLSLASLQQVAPTSADEDDDKFGESSDDRDGKNLAVDLDFTVQQMEVRMARMEGVMGKLLEKLEQVSKFKR